jgi:hypothetical protein
MNTPMLTYPARPLNGGPPRLARPKPGRWIAQPKFNGWRALVCLTAQGQAFMWNRHGEPLSIAGDFGKAVDEAALAFGPDTWLDCEALQRRGSINNTLVLLDLIDPARPALKWHERKQLLLASGVPVLPWDAPPESGRLLVTDEIPAGVGLLEACERFEAVNAAMGETVFEGAVMKREDSPYPIQTRSPDQRFAYWIKHRFIG